MHTHKLVSGSFAIVAVAALLLALGPLFAAPNPSEASGKVVDQDGEPIQGVVVVYAPAKHQETEYTAKTNKKGRYFLVGLFALTGDEWQIRLEAEGYVPTKMTVESRTVNRVLVRDIYDRTLKPGKEIPTVQIKPLGTAKIDFTLTAADMVALPVAPTAAAAGEPGAPVAPAAPVKTDPWDEALMLASAGDLEGAALYFDKAAQEEPEDAERQETLAKVLYQLERYDEAELQSNRAIELAPSKIGPRMVLYSSFVSRGDWEQARNTLQEAREIAPDNLQILEQLAYVANETGETADAIAAYEALTAADPENTTGWLALADAYASAGEIGKSEAAFQRVIDLDPSNADQVFYNMGALMINKPDRTDSETKQAVNAFRKALEINPGYAAAHKQLAFALLGMGDRAGAKGELEAYVKLAPDAADAGQMQQMIKTLN